jgi:hypothetical protein
MRKLLFTFALLAYTMMAGAQAYDLTVQGAYEKTVVVQADSSATASVLFDRAMTALSDWTGPDGKSRAGVDYQNQETHTIIYKGTYSLGFKNTFLGDGWHRMANFTLRVRCKDGRAQLMISVPTMTGIYNRGNIERQWTVGEVAEAVSKTSGNRQERGKQLMADIIETADGILNAMAERLKQKDADEDF